MSLVAKDNRLSRRYTDLAAHRVGGQTLSCSNDFFAKMENLLKKEAPVFQAGVFTEHGQLMDGWESRRRRFFPDGTSDDGLNNDWCIIKLGAQGIIKGINANATHFLGNAPQQISLDACNLQGEPTDNTHWTQLIERTDINPGDNNLIEIAATKEDGIIVADDVWTHVRFNIYPDGGVARLNIYGDIVIESSLLLKAETFDLSNIKNGAHPLTCSDMFFSHMENLLMPDRSISMGDGWETQRRRMVGDIELDCANDWLILQLAVRGSIETIIIDTHHFKGNYPNAFSLEGAVLTKEQALNIKALAADSHLDARLDKGDAKEQLDIQWISIINHTALFADREHTFSDDIAEKKQSFTHVRLKIYPDGGISRMRLWGTSA